MVYNVNVDIRFICLGGIDLLFNSLQFVVFFPLVVILYYNLPYKYRWGMLLVASLYFYMCWEPSYILLMLISISCSYYTALLIGNSSDQKEKKKFLFLNLFINLGILILFKYFNFINSNVRELADYLGFGYDIPDFRLLLPMGISFYTFQALSYSIDVYREHIKPERHFGIFALYITFFPQLVAGPIERSERLLPQFYHNNSFNYEKVAFGLRRMAWGFFKKVVIADRLAILVNNVYNNIYDYDGLTLVVATVFFAFQIYCDFSGYSDIAIGAANVLGYDLMENFNRPYFSKSISEFWSRWHISLSTWFRDYFYIPMGGNRVKVPRYYMNLMLTFLISGLWHGANWTFLIWGFLHGFYLVVGIVIKPLRDKLITIFKIDRSSAVFRLLKVCITFCLVTFAWIFFRANSLNDAIYVISHIFSGINDWASFNYIVNSISGLGLSKSEFMVAVFSIIILEFVQLLQYKVDVFRAISRVPVFARYAIYYSLLLAICLFGVFGQSAFIYFRF